MLKNKRTPADDICTCGHTGDKHNALFGIDPGHGACQVCLCSQFTWKSFTTEYESRTGDGHAKAAD